MSAQLLALVMCFAGVFCLTPLGIYLLWLTAVNRRPRPTALAAGWDFIALIGGLIGFLVCGGLILLTALQSNARYWMRGNLEQLRESWRTEQKAWLAIAALYILALALGIIVTMLRKRRTLSVYNVELESLLETVDAVVKQQAPQALRRGYDWAGLVEITPFIGMGHAEVRIVAEDSKTAQELDLNLRRNLPHARPAPVTPAGWLSTAALFCCVGSICSLGLVLLYAFYFSR